MPDAPAFLPRIGPCLSAAGRYLSSRSHIEAIWQSDRRVTRLTTKVVCNLEPLLWWLINQQKMSPCLGSPMQCAASVMVKANKWLPAFVAEDRA